MYRLLIALLGLQQLLFCNAEIYAIRYNSEFYYEEFTDVPASFGPDMSESNVRGMLVNATPPSACDDSLKPPPPYEFNLPEKWILIVPRYTQEQNCTFEQKVRMAQSKGYHAVIVHNVGSNDLVPMSAKNSTGVEIPSVFVSQSAGLLLKRMYTNENYFIVITAETPFNIQTHLLIPFAVVVAICFIVMIIFMIVKCVKDRRRQARYRLPKSQLNKIPTCKYQKSDKYDTCAICLDDYIEGEKLRVLPCNHVYHMKCIDPWLTKNKRVCPICKRKVFAHDEPRHDTDTDSDTDDTTPLITAGRTGTQGGTFEQTQQERPLRRAARSISQVLQGRNFFFDRASINTQQQERESISSSGSSTDSSNTNERSFSSAVGSILNSILNKEVNPMNPNNSGHDSGHHDPETGLPDTEPHHEIPERVSPTPPSSSDVKPDLDEPECDYQAMSSSHNVHDSGVDQDHYVVDHGETHYDHYDHYDIV